MQIITNAPFQPEIEDENPFCHPSRVYLRRCRIDHCRTPRERPTECIHARNEDVRFGEYWLKSINASVQGSG